MSKKIRKAREEAFLKSFERAQIPFEKLQGKTVLVTGASGLIGRMVVWGLQFLNDKKDVSVRILAMVRNKEKGEEILLFGKAEKERRDTHLFIGDVEKKLCVEEAVDYIIHTASMTASKSFVEHPVEVAMTNINGTKNVLEYARLKNSASVVYLSSMEVYGFTHEETLLSENDQKYLNPLAVRSCYPGSKRMCETLCAAYASEYHVPVKIIRLAQTFGYGVDPWDRRVFAEFGRCVVKEQDIILQTAATSKRMYLDTADSVTALLIILLKGTEGRAYNAANKDTYCSVRDMAQFVADQFAEGRIKVASMETVGEIGFYSPEHRLKMDVTEIESLGWMPSAGLEEMFGRLIEEIREGFGGIEE